MKRYAVLAMIAASLLAVSTPAGAEAPPAGKVPGVQGEFIRNFDAADSKLLQLAEAIPAEKFSWRPAEGVRSVSEVLLHAAGSNYMFMNFVGTALPAGVDLKTFETSTVKKDEVIDLLKKSIAHVKTAAAAMSDADLDAQAKWFMGESPKREILFVMASHNHEHLGQLIAYARMNGITPPWSKKE
ncbi:MAG TPA: DinB family protein [Candidatus Eisenbacteria bacterium]|nr:DinB family protein [Candidatus Eisenbacteria bacterium]